MNGDVLLDVRCGLCADENRTKNLLAQVVTIDGEMWWRQLGTLRSGPEGLKFGLPRGSTPISVPDCKLALDDDFGYAVMCTHHPIFAAWPAQIRDALRSHGPLLLR